MDIMANAQYEYTGENGTATVSVTSKQGDLNQRVQEFLDTVTYQVSPNSDLKNGQVLHVSATYDKNLAAQYHYKPVSTQTTITVQGLPNRYDSLAQIKKSLIKDAKKEAINYVKKNVFLVIMHHHVLYDNLLLQHQFNFHIIQILITYLKITFILQYL